MNRRSFLLAGAAAIVAPVTPRASGYVTDLPRTLIEDIAVPVSRVVDGQLVFESDQLATFLVEQFAVLRKNALNA